MLSSLHKISINKYMYTYLCIYGYIVSVFSVHVCARSIAVAARTKEWSKSYLRDFTFSGGGHLCSGKWFHVSDRNVEKSG